jgi:hypothetical protein
MANVLRDVAMWDGLQGPAQDAISLTPNDGVDVAQGVRGLYIGVTGNVNLITNQGNTVLFTAVPAGVILPIMVKRLLAASTTASAIVGLF